MPQPINYPFLSPEDESWIDSPEIKPEETGFQPRVHKTKIVIIAIILIVIVVSGFFLGILSI